ncbi:PLDc_N domain-containing protein [Saccharopolyspora erythraea]|nr:PLDc_N domain-containing protein [Saccharopolyspora erythraea]
MHASIAHHTAMAVDPTQVAGFALGGAMGLAMLAYVVLFISALISILLSDHSGGMKLAWIVFAFVAPFLGSALWFLFGRRDSRRARTTTA